MKSYKVKMTIAITDSKTIEHIVDAENEEVAMEMFKKNIRVMPNQEMVSITAEELGYRTTKWRDVEDILTTIEKDIEEEEAGENDSDIIDMFSQDKKDWQHILERLIEKDFDGAAKTYSNMDTGSRELIPDRVYDIFDALELI